MFCRFYEVPLEVDALARAAYANAALLFWDVVVLRDEAMPDPFKEEDSMGSVKLAAAAPPFTVISAWLAF